MSECIRSKASVYSSKTDVNSNSDAVGTTDLRLANWFVNIVSKTTSHSLYYRKFCLNAYEAKRVYIQAKLMFIQTVYYFNLVFCGLCVSYIAFNYFSKYRTL